MPLDYAVSVSQNEADPEQDVLGSQKRQMNGGARNQGTRSLLCVDLLVVTSLG